MRSVALAIPHYNRCSLLLEAIQGVRNDPRIGEIVISDDVSTNGSYQALQADLGRDPKFKFFQNKTNIDCYFNKVMAVVRCTSPWVILFDDDNVISTDYLDRLWELPEWDPNTIYCPDFAQPHFDYRAFSGQLVDRHNVAQLMERQHFPTALNTGNYFVNRENYIGVWDGSVNPHTADTIFHAYNWLASGRKLQIVSGLQYVHRVHSGSHYKNNVHKTGNFAAEVEKKLKQLK